jgi:hypothetical protein
MKPKKEVTRKHHRAVLKALKEVIAEETWQRTHGDARLAELVKAKGVYASNNMIRDVRLANDIPDAYSRKMKTFAAQAKGKK